MFLASVLVSSLLLTACLGVPEVKLDHNNCLLRQTYQVDKTGILVTWEGARLRSCHIRFTRDMDNSEGICVYVQTLNISKGQCPPDIQMTSGSSGTRYQFSDCDTVPSGKCITSEYASLKLEANTSTSELSFRITTDTTYQTVTDDNNSQDTGTGTEELSKGLPLGAIIGIMVGVFIPVIIVVIVVAVICIRQADKGSGGTIYQPPKQESSSEIANGSTDIIDPSQPLHSSPTTEEDDISQEVSQSQSMRLSAVV